MAVTEEIAWGDGSGDKIYLTANALEGDQTVLVSSDANTGSARAKTITFSASGASPVTLTVSQEARVSTIPYIRGGGNGSYIDTGITPDQTTKIIIWARNWNVYPGANTCLFGSDNGSTTNKAFLVYTQSSNSIGGIGTCWGSNSVVAAADQWKRLSGYHKYEYGANGFYVDDVLVSSVAAATFSNQYSIYLFGSNRQGSLAVATGKKDICACKIYKNNVLVRDFTAVETPSPGLYDAVSDTVFTNAGTGSFTYGTFNPNAYTPLEYITCSQQQWFNSNVHATYSDGIVATFMLTNTSKKWTAPFGIYNNSMSPDEACIIFFGNTSYSNARAYTRMGSGTSSLTIRSTNTAGTFRNKKLVSVKVNNKMSLYYNNSEQGTGQTSPAMSSSFVSTGNMLVGTMCRANDVADTEYALVGNLYYVGFGSSRSYVPAKVNGVAGMYDNYNDVFYPSESGTAFTAGPEI